MMDLQKAKEYFIRNDCIYMILYRKTSNCTYESGLVEVRKYTDLDDAVADLALIQAQMLQEQYPMISHAVLTNKTAANRCLYPYGNMLD